MEKLNNLPKVTQATYQQSRDTKFILDKENNGAFLTPSLVVFLVDHSQQIFEYIP